MEVDKGEGETILCRKVDMGYERVEKREVRSWWACRAKVGGPGKYKLALKCEMGYERRVERSRGVLKEGQEGLGDNQT